MTFSGFVTMIFAEVVKPVIAMVLSFCLSIGSLFTGPMGNYQTLMLKTLGLDPVHTHVDYTVSGNAAFAATLAGIDISSPDALEEYGLDGLVDEKGMITVSGAFDTYADIGKARVALEMNAPEGKTYGIYLDPSALAVSPDLTRDALPTVDEEISAAYEKHTQGYGFYLDFDEMIDMDSIVSENELVTLESAMKLIVDLYGDMFGALSSDKSVELFGDIYALVKDSADKFYSETEKDGVKAYTYKMTGKEYLEYARDALEIATSEEYAEAYIALVETMLKSLDYKKLATEAGKLAGATEEEIAAMLSEMGEDPTAELMAELREAYPEALAAAGGEMKPFLDALITGEGVTELFGEYGELVATLLPIIHGTTVSSTLSEKDGKLLEDFELTVGANGIVILSVVYSSTTEKHDGEVKTPAEAVPFGTRLTPETIENKVGFEKASTKGVGSVEIEWASEMAPEDTEATVAAPYFYINYKTTMWDAIDAMDDMDETQKTLYKQHYAEDELERSILGTSAVLIDSSVYLPLRQLMENAGYEVSWDADARKAYVTVDGQKIEMTGTIVNNKTYVKVRDFEKLGATVEYEETIYYADDWNDFSKSCYATITFE